MKAVIALGLALFGVSALAQEKWEVKTTVDYSDDKRMIYAESPLVFGEPYKASNLVVRCEEGILDVSTTYIHLNRKGEDDASILADFDDEEPKEIYVLTSTDGNSLYLLREAGVEIQDRNEGILILSKKLAATNTFATRLDYHDDNVVTIKYDMNGAKEAIGKVLKACGVEPEQNQNGETE